jgi:hypothetical protein
MTPLHILKSSVMFNKVTLHFSDDELGEKVHVFYVGQHNNLEDVYWQDSDSDYLGQTGTLHMWHVTA